MQDLISLEKIINSELNTKINSTYIKHNELRLNVDPGDIMEVVLFLKNNPSTKFRQLIDVTAVDYPNSEKRFRLVYLLLSLENNKRISIDYYIKENDLVSSITAVFPSANWMEREVFDMYGINFKDHPDLRRILTDYNFEGHPLRKDFPLTGHNEVRYNEENKKVVYEPVKLEQNYRNFDYESPWEGTKYIKKETEK
ncbi:MAG: NADH-quinone oxidoreductase subunit C [Candidatus Pelagibacter sp.]|nr:NADH-quinone oxidoreductase subunit C [Candidatus Pelagibacter sp.]|tara:strand:- start:22071 stop:22661 length:591 start_codon:yes stop_codon:yes gene_type:complete